MSPTKLKPHVSEVMGGVKYYSLLSTARCALVGAAITPAKHRCKGLMVADDDQVPAPALARAAPIHAHTHTCPASSFTPHHTTPHHTTPHHTTPHHTTPHPTTPHPYRWCGRTWQSCTTWTSRWGQVDKIIGALGPGHTPRQRVCVCVCVCVRVCVCVCAAHTSCWSSRSCEPRGEHRLLQRVAAQRLPRCEGASCEGNVLRVGVLGLLEAVQCLLRSSRERAPCWERACWG